MGRRALGTLLILLSTMSVIVAPNIPRAHATNSAGLYFDHIVFIMMENEGIQNICAKSGIHIVWPCNGPNTPYLSSLANSSTLAQQYTSVYCQPKVQGCSLTSQPNYLAVIGGSTFKCPSTCSNNPNQTLIDRFETAGISWRAYMESMRQPNGCDTSNSQSPYNPIHNPLIDFTEFVNSGVKNATLCSSIVLANPSTCLVTDCALVNDLNNESSSAPNFMWLTPDDCHNMHGTSPPACSNHCNTIPVNATCMQEDDNYMKTLIPNILASRTFTTTRSALFITFDEGLDFCPINGSNVEDCLYGVWAGPQANIGVHSASFYNHYSLTKTIEANWNLPSLTSNDANATAMAEFFKPDFILDSNPSSVAFPLNSSGSFSTTIVSVNGFSGNVNLTSSISPPTGLSVSCSPAVVLGGSGVSACSVDGSVAGNYNVTTTGTSGPISRSAQISVSVESGTVGGAALSIDKLRLLLTLAPIWLGIPLSGISLVIFLLKNRKTSHGTHTSAHRSEK